MGFEWWIVWRLVVSVLCGGLIGWERGEKQHAAGLRTHILVCLGAATLMITSECIVLQYRIPSEIMRMGAQIVSGIGFLGAGSIIMDGNRIRGITTAAGLWATACVGIAIGVGYYGIALLVVVLMLFAMLGLRSFAHRAISEQTATYEVILKTENASQQQEALEKLKLYGVEMQSFRTVVNEDQSVSIQLSVVLPQESLASIMEYVTGHKEILQFEVKPL